MKTYYGTKALAAKPMTLGEYNSHRGWDIPENEDPNAPGYLVEYQDGGQPNHPNHEGYISWSPKEVFEAAYQQTGTMSFGHALIALKAGERVARKGWNGKGMWIALTAGSSFQAKHAKEGHAAKIRASELNQDDYVDLLPHIDMRTASGEMCVGWLASQTDMLADDWGIVK